uniref:SCY domain-containing protein n=1 Tax=Panagrellus redivivus TaxID=6233 RepID=A0A7E4VW06_PANRE
MRFFGASTVYALLVVILAISQVLAITDDANPCCDKFKYDAMRDVCYYNMENIKILKRKELCDSQLHGVFNKARKDCIKFPNQRPTA